MKRSLILLFGLFLTLPLWGQLPTAGDFSEANDTLTTLTSEYFGVKSKVGVWRVMRRGKELDVYTLLYDQATQDGCSLVLCTSSAQPVPASPTCTLMTI